MPIKIPLFFLRHLRLIQGHKMFLYPKNSIITQMLSTFGVYESLETEVVKKLIKKGDVVLDIGANVGYYTLIFAKLVGEEGKVFAFEPDPDNFALLEKNVEVNCYRNVVLVQKAIANKTGVVRLYLCEDNKGNHRICDARDARESIAVEAIRLDDYFEAYNEKIDFIKIDIEGAEQEALLGASSLLKRNKNIKIATEFCPLLLGAFGVKSEEYLCLLTQYGFELYDMDEQKYRMKPAIITELLETYTPEMGNLTNLLCVRKNEQDKLVARFSNGNDTHEI